MSINMLQHIFDFFLKQRYDNQNWISLTVQWMEVNSDTYI